MRKAEERARPSAPQWAWILAVSAYALLFAPLVTVAVYSFLVSEVQASGETVQVVGLEWYRRLFQNEALGDALTVSLEIAAVVSVVSSILGGLGALALERGRFPGRNLLAAATLVPLVLPELVQGLASVIWFAVLRLSLGTHSIILAHATFAVSYVVVTVRARLSGFDSTLTEAAADLGAPPFTVFRRVTLPLALPGVVAGAMMAFTLSFDDFLISFFTAGVGADTLPMKLYAMIRFGMNREMYALSSLLIAITAIGLLAQTLAQRRGGLGLVKAPK